MAACDMRKATSGIVLQVKLLFQLNFQILLFGLRTRKVDKEVLSIVIHENQQSIKSNGFN